MKNSYSNESFDAVQRVANALTDDDRQAGRTAPAHGYSAANFRIAQVAVDTAVTEDEALQSARTTVNAVSGR